ncbi:hypothetical protein Taro_056883 [Colocasia esculenta]|uniref:Uncharacterized protein n=1 Tax=Colocasia esculenta TaxID=4460 RepID=A0A843XXG2_COLES|nr:hypothetical protein [Colocasia esculenta]
MGCYDARTSVLPSSLQFAALSEHWGFHPLSTDLGVHPLPHGTRGTERGEITGSAGGGVVSGVPWNGGEV